MFRSSLALCALLTIIPAGDGGLGEDVGGGEQVTRSPRELTSDLTAADPTVRTRAACGLRELGDRAVDAIPPLVTLLADAAPVDGMTCGQRWSRHGENELTSPGEEAAAALAAIGTRSFQPLLSALRRDAWVARRNAAWALGALDDNRAVGGLSDTLRDREAPVREQSAWALGAIDDTQAVPALMAALKDADAGVRRQAAWALGALDDPRATPGLIQALEDADDRTRSQAAWALGAIDDRAAVQPLARALADKAADRAETGGVGAGRHRRRRRGGRTGESADGRERRRARAGRVGARSHR